MAAIVVAYFLLLVIFTALNQADNRLADAFLLIAALIFIVVIVFAVTLARHPVVWLTVGPEGIEPRFSLCRKLAWTEFDRAWVDQTEHLLLPPSPWLRLRLRPDHAPVLRSWLPVVANRLMPGLPVVGIPLHHLHGSSMLVLQSVQRFFPVNKGGPKRGKLLKNVTIAAMRRIDIAISFRILVILSNNVSKD